MPISVSSALALPDANLAYQSSLAELIHAIEWNQGHFSLILAHCNSPYLRQRALWDLDRRGTLALQTVTLPPSAELMFSAICESLSVDRLKTHAGSAIAISGFEGVSHIDKLLASAETVRDELRKVFHCPIVWWMNDSSLIQLIRLAPNIHSWFTSVEFSSEFSGEFFAPTVDRFTAYGT